MWDECVIIDLLEISKIVFYRKRQLQIPQRVRRNPVERRKVAKVARKVN